MDTLQAEDNVGIANQSNAMKDKSGTKTVSQLFYYKALAGPKDKFLAKYSTHKIKSESD